MSNSWKVAERKVAKRLGLWACGDEMALRRMPLQGRMMEEYLGDIIVNEQASEDVRKKAADFISRFMVDVKRRVSKQSSTGWHFEQLLTSEKHQIFAWWKKLKEAAAKYKKRPLLIITKGDGNWFIIIEDPHVSEFTGADHIVICRRKTCRETLVAFNLDDFLKISYELVKANFMTVYMEAIRS